MKKLKKEYLTQIIGSIVFLTLTSLTFWLVFRNFNAGSGLYLPGLLTWKTGISILVLLFLFYALDGLRLLFVFKTMHTDVSFKLMIKLVFVNVFASGVTPLATGGGFAQIYLLSKYKVPVGIATAATTIRTVIASIMIFASVPIILIGEKGIRLIIPINHGVIYSLILILLYLALFIGLVKHKVLLKKIIFSLLKILNRMHIIKFEKYETLKASIDREISHFAASLLRFWHGDKTCLILSLLSSLGYLFTLFLFPFILLRSMGTDVHIMTVLSIQVIITFLIYFTPTPGGSGVAEGGFALIFSHFVSPEYVPPLTFYWRSLTIYLGMIIGLVIFYKEIWKKDNAK